MIAGISQNSLSQDWCTPTKYVKENNLNNVNVEVIE